MELWRGTIATHSLLVHRSDETHGTSVSFDDERWLRFVPVRLPWTRLIQERLPAGAAGVLLNKSHAHHDLVLVLSAEDKRLFDDVNGRRSIAAIAKRASGDHHRVRALFEKLWWYDQVVFDTSHAG